MAKPSGKRSSKTEKKSIKTSPTTNKKSTHKKGPLFKAGLQEPVTELLTTREPPHELLATLPRMIPPAHITKNKEAKSEWYRKEQRTRGTQLKSMMVDELAWKSLLPKLESYQSLACYRDTLKTLLPGFGLWFLGQLPNRGVAKGVVESHELLSYLPTVGITDEALMEFLGIVSNTYWPIEAAWVRWLKEKYGGLRKKGVSSKLNVIKTKIIATPVSPLFKEHAELAAQSPEAIKACIKEFGHLDYDVKNVARKKMIVNLISWLLDRNFSKNKSYQVVAHLLYSNPGQSEFYSVRQAYTRKP